MTPQAYTATWRRQKCVTVTLKLELFFCGNCVIVNNSKHRSGGEKNVHQHENDLQFFTQDKNTSLAFFTTWSSSFLQESDDEMLKQTMEKFMFAPRFIYCSKSIQQISARNAFEMV